MDSHSLKGASTYLNNLLLARGLLRNGKPVEFAHPSKGDGGREATMAQIINLVHDLILRRDREQEQRESLTQTLRNVRAENQRATLAIDRLQQRNDDLQRHISLSQSSERSAKNAHRAAESSARSLREEMLRLKTTVQQVRTACANDVRKRDVQIQRLKTHLTAQQRGNKTGLVGASITITPGLTTNGTSSTGRDEDVLNVDDPEYSLKQETTEFLTQLSQSLSDENDNLIGLVRSTLGTLREVQGLPEHGQRGPEPDPAQADGNDSDSSMMHALPTSYDALATDMDHVLENLRNLLTNPNFVSIHEVESREEEIIKLREGWEKMESRWREAVTLMQSWRQRMLEGGDTVTLEELKLGFGLGDRLAPLAEEDEEMDSEVEDMEEEEASDIEEAPALPSPEKLIPEERTDIFDIQLKPRPRALKESDGNIRSPRKVFFAPSNNSTPTEKAVDENISEVDLLAPTSKRSSAAKSQASSVSGSQLSSGQRSRPAQRESGIPRSTRKRRSSPLTHEDERSPKLTVQEKLDVAANEAEEAATAAAAAEAKAKAAEKEMQEGSNVNVNMRSKRTPRKTMVKGRPRRRKSTLSPEELEALMGLAD